MASWSRRGRTVLIDWFADHSFRRLMRNASWLLGGNAVGGTLGLAAILVAARYLGPAQFGVIALITTYVALLDRLLNFQTWQALIRYGAKARAAEDAIAFRRLVKVCTLLDLGSALLGAGVAAIFAGTVARLFGLGDEAGRLMTLYSVVIAANLTGVPTAILRLFDRFGVLAAHKSVQGGMGIAGVIIAWALGGGMGAVLLAFAAAQVTAHLFLITCGWRALAHEGVRGIWTTPIQGLRRDLPGLLTFVFWTNVESSVKILREIDVFVVKAILSVEAVGLYYVARKAATAMETAVAPFYYAIYPELARFSAKGELTAFLSLMWRSAVTGGALAAAGLAAFLVFGDWILASVIGDAYRAAYGVTALCLLGTAIWAAAQPLSPAMFSLGLVKRAFLIHLLAAIFYIATLAPLLTWLGLIGAGAGYTILHVFWATLATVSVKAGLREEKTSERLPMEETQPEERFFV